MDENRKQADPAKEVKTIQHVYAAAFASLLLTFVPHTLFAIIALIFFTGVMAAAYRIRRKAAPESLAANHMTYLIRTIWISSLMMAATVFLATFYILGSIDPAPIQACMDSILAGGAYTMNDLKPCLDNFIQANLTVLIIGTIMAGGPVLVYFLYRFAQGLSRAQKGHRLGDPKKWL